MLTFSDLMSTVYLMRYRLLPQQSHSMGEMLRRLVLIHAVRSPEDMKNRVEYL
jgi:hypothetical protein